MRSAGERRSPHVHPLFRRQVELVAGLHVEGRVPGVDGAVARSGRAGGDNFLQSSLSRAVIFSSLTKASGFGTLWLSEHPGTATMGELLTISLAWTLVTTLFFLPALLQSARVR